jgi:hypothetical protein
MKLNAGQLRLLVLTAKGASGPDGWTSVSEVVWPVIAALPADLVEREKLEVGGRARLTDAGKVLLAYS